MKRSGAVSCVTLLATLAASCNHTQESVETRAADIQALRDDTAQVMKDFQAKDLNRIASHYAPDAIVMAPGAPTVHGPEGAKTAYKEMLADPAFSIQLEASRVEVARSGDIGYVQGPYTLSMTNPIDRKPLQDKGSFLVVYRKQPDGSWKAIADIATSEILVAPALPAKN